jgi:hypothetical protein
MADITKCKGTNCPIKQNCYRYTAKEDEFYQAYFTVVPLKNDECDMYWERLMYWETTKNK